MMQTRLLLDELRLATVCSGARCPNLPECWSRHTATFLILGRHCTRACRYCAVDGGEPDPVEPDEPERLAEAAAAMGLRHVVITSVTRDDLADEGAGHYARCVQAVRGRLAGAIVETLTPDFHARGECIEPVLAAGVAIFNHNVEMVRRLTPALRPQADYDRSLRVLAIGRERLDASGDGRAARRFTKSGLMIGFGETRGEIIDTLSDLRAVGCEIVTIGQYLQPSPAHVPVARYYPPGEFDELGAEARAMGFVSVSAGPFVRSSYNAAEVYAQARGSLTTEPQSHREDFHEGPPRTTKVHQAEGFS